jgi:heat shock protein HslJ
MKEVLKMKGKDVTIVIVALVLLLAGCGPSPAAGQSLLEGTEWVLVSLEGDPPLAGAVPSATFTADQIEGSTGCNHYAGAYTADDSDITIGDVAHTEMACMEPEGAMDQERDFLAALASVASYRLDGERLELLDETGSVLLVFEPPSAVSAATETPTPVPPTPTTEPTPVPPPVFEPPAGFVPYQDAPTGISIYIPESWVVTGAIPGEFAILQSYPEDKYVGGEAREPGDTKCDLTIRPEDVSLSDTIEALRADPMTTIVSEAEVALRSGEPGTRMEINNMGPAMVLFAEVNQRTVVLTCFGDFAPFDEIAPTLGATESE